MLGNYRDQILFTLLIALLFTMVGCSEDISNEERKQKAQQMSDSHKYSAAIIELKNVLQKDASDSEARLALADIYILTGQGASAEKELKNIPVDDQKDERAVILLAEALIMQKKYQAFREKIVFSDGFSLEGKEKLRLQRAKVNAALGKIDLAESEYKNILSENPTIAEAFIGLAMIDLGRKRFTEGLANIDKAIAIDDEFAEAWRLKGIVYNKQRKYPESEQAFRKAVELYKKTLRTQEEFISRIGLIQTLLMLKKSDQFAAEVKALQHISAEHPSTLYFSALENFLNKKYSDAESALSLLVGRMPDHLPSLLLLGSVHYAEGNYEQANTYLTQFVNSVPTHLQARKILGATRLKLKRPEDALEILTPVADVEDAEILTMIGQAASQNDQRSVALSFFKRASKALPENYQLREELAKSYLQDGEFDNAIAALETASGDDEVSGKILITYAYLQKKEIKKAKQTLKSLVDKYPKDESVKLLQVTIDLIEGKRAEARIKLEKMEIENPESIPAIYALAKMDMEDGDLKKSRKRLTKILSLDDKNIKAMISLAQLEEQAGAAEKSIMWLEQARRDDATAQLPRLILSRYLLNIKEFDRSLEIAQELVAIDDKNAISLTQYATVLLAMNRTEEAAQVYENIIKYYPSETRAYLALSTIYSRLGEKDKVANLLSRMEKSTNEKLLVDLARIELELRSKNPDVALKLAEKLLSKYPDNFAGNMLLASAKIALNDVDGAIDVLKKAIKYSDRKELIIQLAKLQLRQNKKKSAVTELERWLSKNKDPDVQFFLASVYQNMGAIKKAEQHYNKLLERDGSNPLILNNLTLIYLQSDIDAALKTAELAMERGSERGEIIDTYGWVLVKAGRVEEGLKQLQKAHRKIDNPEVSFHLAFALEKMGEHRKALALVNELKTKTSLNSKLKEQVLQLQNRLSVD